MPAGQRPAPGLPSSWKVDYYAPGVGRILTTLATPSFERRNTELLSYDLGDGAREPAVDERQTPGRARRWWAWAKALGRRKGGAS